LIGISNFVLYLYLCLILFPLAPEEIQASGFRFFI
jgi:hypothetical protein